MKEVVWWCVAVVAAVLLAWGPARVCAEPTDAEETVQSAVYLLHAAMTPADDATDLNHKLMLLKALRQMEDPALKPYFSQVYQSSEPAMKVYGILGLAECSPEKHLDLERLASLDKDSATLQDQIVAAAMDAKLLSDEQVLQLLKWPGLPNEVKVTISAPLVEKNALPSLDHLKEAARPENQNLARRTLALAMLLQLGDTTALAGLRAVAKSSDANKRDSAVEMVLRFAERYELKSCAAWALEVANDPQIAQKVGLLALRVAIRFHAPGAAEEWRKRFEADSDAAHRNRLALHALMVASEVEPGFFDPPARCEDPFLRQIGLTGAAVAAKKGVGPAGAALVAMCQPIANIWAMEYAHRHAAEPDSGAKELYVALIRAGDQGGDANRDQRLDDALVATQLYYDDCPADAVPQLRAILSDPKTSLLSKQSILIGLVSAKTKGADMVIQGLKLEEPEVEHIALVLHARSGKPMSAAQLDEFSALVRGGGDLQPALRIQAAWMYLKITNQFQTALAAAMASGS